MADIKTVGVKELKNNLSAYLRDVRRGARILVSDRNTVIAELRQPSAAREVPEPEDPIVAEWLRGGFVTPPSRKKAPLPASPVHLEEGVAERLLDEDRDEEGS
jgi:antitoxin (DNA-binding transcriptional repressor) of toxin-antitoxin stability system